MTLRLGLPGAIIAAIFAVSGCTVTSPADYAASMPSKERKWNSPQCRQMRTEAANYQSREKPAPIGLIALGPYGLGILAAAKEHQEKKRRQFTRDMHLACSSQPLPANLQNLAAK